MIHLALRIDEPGELWKDWSCGLLGLRVQGKALGQPGGKTY